MPAPKQLPAMTVRVSVEKLTAALVARMENEMAVLLAPAVHHFWYETFRELILRHAEKELH